MILRETKVLNTILRIFLNAFQDFESYIYIQLIYLFIPCALIPHIFTEFCSGPAIRDSQENTTQNSLSEAYHLVGETDLSTNALQGDKHN